MSIIRKEQLTNPLSASYATTASYALNGGGSTAKAYGSFYEAQSQQFPSTPQTLQLTNTDISSGLTLTSNGIQAQNSGVYDIQIDIQLSSTTITDTAAVYLYNINTNQIIQTSYKGFTGFASNAPILFSWSSLAQLQANDVLYVYAETQTGTFTTRNTTGQMYPLVVTVTQIA